MGFTASAPENSLYIANRNGSAVLNAPEHIQKYNLGNGKFTEISFEQTDFVTKELQIVNDQLLAFGGQYVNKYNLDLGSQPETHLNGYSFLTRCPVLK